MPLGMEIGLGPGHTVRWGPSSPKERGTAVPPTFRPMSIVTKRSPISAAAGLLFSEGTGMQNAGAPRRGSAKTERMQYSDHLRCSHDVLSKTRLRASWPQQNVIDDTRLLLCSQCSFAQSTVYAVFTQYPPVTACTPGSAPDPTLGIEYGKPLPLPFFTRLFVSFVNKSQNT